MKLKKVVRVLIIEGEADWVEETLKISHISPERPLNLGISKITEILREEVFFEKSLEELKEREGGE